MAVETTTDILLRKTGGPAATIVEGPDPYPPADADNKVKITGDGWKQMLRRRRRLGGSNG